MAKQSKSRSSSDPKAIIAEILARRGKHNDAGKTVEEWAVELNRPRQRVRDLIREGQAIGMVKLGHRDGLNIRGTYLRIVVYQFVPAK